MKILVLGGSGLIGNFFIHNSTDHEIITTFNKNKISTPNMISKKINLPDDWDKLQKLILEKKPDVILNTMENGIRLPMSSMPGEQVEHVFAGPMHNEGVHFLEAIALDRPVMVTPQEARQVMEVYMAADLSVDRNEPVTLPLNSNDMSSIRIPTR